MNQYTNSIRTDRYRVPERVEVNSTITQSELNPNSAILCTCRNFI